MSKNGLRLTEDIDYILVLCKFCNPDNPDPNCEVCGGRGKHSQIISDDRMSF